MKLEISQWLNSNQDYPAGVALYDRYGDNQVLKQLFAHGEYSYSRRKLVAALELLLEQEPAAPEPLAGVSATAPKSVDPNIRQQMRPLLDERTMLHNRLGLYQELNLSQEEMKHIAFRMLELTRQLAPLYQQTIPVVPAPAIVDFNQLSGLEQLKKLSNLRSLRTKIKKKPERAHELPAIEAQIHQLEHLINIK
ncbi:hypothetical protein AHMF7605_10450 [Adhaeribacter arboris]|uniref:Uncharacterized protein n=1 Tax=Adhaeribacter arboris TaxID=2072846 RepID=A0A2T2YEH0_9BACT|nr:hypothetical protein [Adhaeribacter arboris]PSR53907.1 hypothetical protein AHMF7605_10450 [Adhaeribacter arboris]